MQIHFQEQDTTLEQEPIQIILERGMLQLEIITVQETATAIITLPEIAQTTITIITQQEATTLLRETKA